MSWTFMVVDDAVIIQNICTYMTLDVMLDYLNDIHQLLDSNLTEVY